MPTVLMLGSYDSNLYSRGRILYKALKRKGATVDLFLPRGFFACAYFLFRLLERNFDVVIATGKPALLTAWATKWLHGRKVLFDVFISDFDTLVLDRKQIKPNSLRAKFYWWLDRFCCRRATHNALDTADHVEYFVDEFGLTQETFSVIPVGADDELFAPRARARNTSLAGVQRPFLVHFHGTYIPLQGAEYIVQAAKLLDGAPIRFRMIGRGQDYGKVRALAQRLNLSTVEFVDLLPLEQLPAAIAEADVCLGAFGVSGKANRVITNKCFEALAMGKPLITARTGVAERMLGSGAMLVEPGNPKELANAIRTLQRNAALCEDLARRGLQLFRERYTIDRIGDQLLAVLAPLLPAQLVPQHEKTEAPKRIIIRKPTLPDSDFELEPQQPEVHAEPEEHAEEHRGTGELNEPVNEVEEHVPTVPRTARQHHDASAEIEIREADEPEPIAEPESYPEIVRPVPKRHAPLPAPQHTGDPAFLQKLDRLFTRAIESQRKPKSRVPPTPMGSTTSAPHRKVLKKATRKSSEKVIPKARSRAKAKVSKSPATGKRKKRS